MFKVRIVTPSGLYRETEASIINVVTTEGHRGILPNHMSIICMLVPSKMSLVEAEGRFEFAIGEGMIYFQDNLATVLIDTVESKEEIDVARAKRAKETAEKLLETEPKNVMAKTALNKALARLEVSK